MRLPFLLCSLQLSHRMWRKLVADNCGRGLLQIPFIVEQQVPVLLSDTSITAPWALLVNRRGFARSRSRAPPEQFQVDRQPATKSDPQPEALFKPPGAAESAVAQQQEPGGQVRADSQAINGQPEQVQFGAVEEGFLSNIEENSIDFNYRQPVLHLQSSHLQSVLASFCDSVGLCIADRRPSKFGQKAPGSANVSLLTKETELYRCN